MARIHPLRGSGVGVARWRARSRSRASRAFDRFTSASLPAPAWSKTTA